MSSYDTIFQIICMISCIISYVYDIICQYYDLMISPWAATPGRSKSLSKMMRLVENERYTVEIDSENAIKLGVSPANLLNQPRC